MKKNIIGLYKAILLRIKLTMTPFFQGAVKWLSFLNSIFALIVIFSLIYAFGFSTNFITSVYMPLFIISFYFFLCEYTLDVFRLNPRSKSASKGRTSPFVYIFYVIVVVLSLIWLMPVQWINQAVPFCSILRHQYFLISIVAIESVLKLSIVTTHSLSDRIEPQWLMVGSFLLIIMSGTVMLLFPRSTSCDVSFIDTLFVTVSSVCVTGLTPIDIPSTFTLTGQIIILILIQLGGIGVMTFTSFFGLMITGSHSAQNKLLIKDLIDPENSVSQIFKTLRNILFIAFLIELLGAWSIYSAIGDHTWHGFYVALFHSISAFCNAGISIIPDGLYNVAIRSNYAVLHSVAWLIILGGIGFPILFNVWQWLKNSICLLVRRIFGKYNFGYRRPHLITSNTIIALTITAFLIISGTIIFFITEYDNTLAGKSFWDKYSLSFFMSVTPRTAGFNALPMADLMPVTVMYMILYMWIGGSPMSTAGGIKTTTFGIGILNIWNTLRGRGQIELRRRTISSDTTHKAFVIILASLIVITIGTMTIIAFEPEKSILAIVFEVVSAFATVGLSLDLTPGLCAGSKIVLICIMFIGRMGLLTILGCIIPRSSSHFYAYPSEHIPMN